MLLSSITSFSETNVLPETLAIVAMHQTQVTVDLMSASLEKTLSGFLQETVQACLLSSGLTPEQLREKKACACVGFVNPSPVLGEPFLFGSLLASSLGLATPGMTLEMGASSGLLAAHAARGFLGASTSHFAVVAEILPTSQDSFLLNVICLQPLGAAMLEQRQVHGLIRNTSATLELKSESALASCCREAKLNRDQVLRIDAQSTLTDLVEWIEETEESQPAHHPALAATGFCTKAPNGLQVVLLLQPPTVTPAESVTAGPDEKAWEAWSTRGKRWHPYHKELFEGWHATMDQPELFFLSPQHGKD